jgi:hypothetical protein
VDDEDFQQALQEGVMALRDAIKLGPYTADMDRPYCASEYDSDKPCPFLKGVWKNRLKEPKCRLLGPLSMEFKDKTVHVVRHEECYTICGEA